MNSIERRFKLISQQNPHLAAYSCLVEALAYRKYKHKAIRRNFLHLIPKDDYEFETEKDLVKWLDKITNTRMDVQNR